MTDATRNRVGRPSGSATGAVERPRTGGFASTVRRWLGLDVLTSQATAQEARLDRLEDLIRSYERRLKRLDKALTRQEREAQALGAAVGEKGLAGQLRMIRRDVQAGLRIQALEGFELPPPYDLLARRSSLCSRHEDDGLCLEVLKRIGLTTGVFVDIGSGLSGGAMGVLARECGWRGVMIDANPDHVRGLACRFASTQVVPIQALVSRENVNDLIAGSGFADSVDVLSIDIDGMDYWVLDALTACRPALIVLEFNFHFGFERSVTVPYDPAFDRRALDALDPVLRKRYYGASLPAYVKLCRRMGYRLITTAPSGGNALFLRDDVAPGIPGLALTDLPYMSLDTYKVTDIFTIVERFGLSVVEV